VHDAVRVSGAGDQSERPQQRRVVVDGCPGEAEDSCQGLAARRFLADAAEDGEALLVAKRAGDLCGVGEGEQTPAARTRI
jgi:hypothetical protein